MLSADYNLSKLQKYTLGALLCLARHAILKPSNPKKSNIEPMLIRLDKIPAITADKISPLNALWVGLPRADMTLPTIGHLFVVCPLDGVVSVAGRRVDSAHYLYLNPQMNTPHSIIPLASNARVLICCVSPGFVAHMAEFLEIPAHFSELLDGIPLPKGDTMSDLLHLLADETDPDNADDLFLDAIGQVLQLLRLRHSAVKSLADNKKSTQADLVPRLLQARQFIEAHYLEPIKTSDVAGHIAISEYHFARLFKSAFDMTVHQYVLRLRLDEARRRLEFSDARITDIALDVGYNSLSAFITAFRNYCGMSPSAYQSRAQN